MAGKRVVPAYTARTPEQRALIDEFNALSMGSCNAPITLPITVRGGDMDKTTIRLLAKTEKHIKQVRKHLACNPDTQATPELVLALEAIHETVSYMAELLPTRLGARNEKELLGQ